MKGLIEESIETSLKAIQLNADFAPAHNNLAIAYLEKEAYDLAAEHADKAVKLGYDMAPEILNEINEHRK
jgi:tetratricopeptide (TPR) repeat protein